MRQPMRPLELMRLLPIGCRGIRARCRLAGRGPDQCEVVARWARRRAGRAVPASARQGLLQGRRARRDHRRGGERVGVDHPCRLRRLRHGLHRHQRADQVPRPASRDAHQGGVHGLQQAGLRDRGAQEPRHHRAEDSRGQEARRAAHEQHLRPMAAVRQAQRHRHLQGDGRNHRHAGARADAGRRAARRRARLLVPDLRRPQGPRRAGRRYRAAADGRITGSSSTATRSS